MAGANTESEVMSKMSGSRGTLSMSKLVLLYVSTPKVSVPFRMAAYGKSGVRLMGFV